MFVELNIDNFQGIMNPISIDFKALSKKRDKSKYFLTHDNVKINKIVGITGANASGKSSIVNAIKYIKEFIYNENNIEEKKRKFIYAQNDENRTTKISCIIYNSTNNEIERGYYKYSLEYSIKGIYEQLDYKRNINNQWIDVLSFNSENFISDITFKFKYYRNLAIHYGREDKAEIDLKLCKAFYEYFNEKCFDQNNIESLNTTIKQLDEKKQSKLLKAIDKCTRLVDSTIKESLIDDETLYFKTNKGKWLKYEDLSIGTQKFIEYCICLSKLIYNNGIFICDEIENCFNFDLLKYIFVIFSMKEPIQLLFTTNNKFTFDIKYEDNTRLINVEQMFVIEKNHYKTTIKNNMIRYDKSFSNYYNIPEIEKFGSMSNYISNYEDDN